jgi:hypothetical protein
MDQFSYVKSSFYKFLGQDQSGPLHARSNRRGTDPECLADLGGGHVAEIGQDQRLEQIGIKLAQGLADTPDLLGLDGGLAGVEIGIVIFNHPLSDLLTKLRSPLAMTEFQPAAIGCGLQKPGPGLGFCHFQGVVFYCLHRYVLQDILNTAAIQSHARSQTHQSLELPHQDLCQSCLPGPTLSGVAFSSVRHKFQNPLFTLYNAP